MIEKYVLARDSDCKTLPMIPTPHDCVIMRIREDADFLIFEFEDDISHHDSISHSYPNAKSLIMRFHKADSEYNVYRCEKHRFQKTPQWGYMQSTTEELLALTNGKSEVTYLYHHVAYSSIIIELNCQNSVLVELRCDYVELEWIGLKEDSGVWRSPDDDTQPIISAKEQIVSNLRECHLALPKTALVFFMSKGVEYLAERYGATRYDELFPRFLNRCPIWHVGGEQDICFLDGGRGAPQAVDTVETLRALGVKNMIAVGMCGAYSRDVKSGDILAPNKAFVEEGTSPHYYEHIEYAEPDGDMLSAAVSALQAKPLPVVSTDSVYRQTFYKEQLWRDKGAVGVDMETSAFFSVAKYWNLHAVSLLMVSDVHPLSPDEPKWDWKMTKDMRSELFEKGLALARMNAR